MPSKDPKQKDLSTEEKIKAAARVVFTKKGYAGTRTRDIAEESGLNLALLNYYFRSKEKLFEMIMMEKMQKLFGVLDPILNDEETTIEKKVDLVATQYIEMLIENPDLPLFVLSEIRHHPERITSKIEGKKLLTESVFVKQLLERRSDILPVHFIMSLLGMTIFPFVARPLFQNFGSISTTQFAQMMQQRKALIPRWVKLMLKSK